ncbi:MAG: DUF2969 family protein, partial [Enterococcus sp.]
AYGPKEFEIFMSEENIGSTKTLDAAVETVIRQWNLQD